MNRTSFLRGNRVGKIKFDSSSLITDSNDITICAQSIIINAKRKSFFQENRPKGYSFVIPGLKVTDNVQWISIGKRLC
jgi:hypothetical protein